MKLPIATIKSSAPPALVAAFLRRADGVSSVHVHGHLDEWVIDVTFCGVKYHLDRQLGDIQAFATTETGSASNDVEFATIVGRIPRGPFSGLLALLRGRGR